MCCAVRENESNSPRWESLQMSGCKCLMKGRSRSIDGICFGMPVCVMKTRAQVSAPAGCIREDQINAVLQAHLVLCT